MARPSKNIDAGTQTTPAVAVSSGNDPEAENPIARGIGVIQAQLKTLPATPGVYRMIDRRGDALYVGKAHNLRKRVASYTTASKLTLRLSRVLAETAALEIVRTHTEVEALLLESNLIKRLRPRYNVLLRDDKSFPYILITSGHDWARIMKYRGARTQRGEYFGPFASAGAVNRTLTVLQRAFLLRSCSDSVFASRTRPCLLYQIKRCCAPCVDRVSRDEYEALLEDARDFLSGRSQDTQRRLANRMQVASEALEFEAAASYRDRIRALTQVQAHQDINVAGVDEADVIGAHQDAGQTCIQVFFFRAGRNYGNRAYFPRHDRRMPVPEVLGAFLGQFYDNKPPPRQILLSHRVPEQALIAEALGHKAERKVRLISPQRGDKRKMVEHSLLNAREAHARHLAESASQRRLLEGVAAAFELDGTPRRIEVFDNSHIAGTNAYGAMIVAGPDGLMKSAYRKFTIRGARAKGVPPVSADRLVDQGVHDAGLGEGPCGGYDANQPPAPGEIGVPITPGDDYGMMREVLTRRFSRALKEDPDRDRGLWPDLVVIDGGPGQMSTACGVLADLGVEDVAVVAIAKGPDRDAGRERFYRPEHAPLTLDPQDPVLYFLQRLRDEAHRFAIGSHRAKRSKSLARSVLDEIPGIGARRKRALLHHFGSAREVARAGLADLETVEGISGTVAKKVYDHFHDES